MGVIFDNPFVAAAARLPRNIPRLNHGRDPIKGFDCAGLFLWIFREAGYSIDRLDRPYGQEAQYDPRRGQEMVDAILTRFDEIPNDFSKWRDGDVVIIIEGSGKRANHIGVHVGGIIYHFTMRMHRTSARLKFSTIAAAYRLRELCD